MTSGSGVPGDSVTTDLVQAMRDSMGFLAGGTVKGGCIDGFTNRRGIEK